MVGKYYIVSDTPFDPGEFVIKPTDIFYNIVGYTDGSYQVYSARLFGLTYAQYLKMGRDLYGARIKGKGHKYPSLIFKNKSDAERLCKELNLRFFAIMKKLK